jgi:hypothetical protein
LVRVRVKVGVRVRARGGKVEAVRGHLEELAQLCSARQAHDLAPPLVA